MVACCPTICKDNWGCWSKWELSESVRGRVGCRSEVEALVEDLPTSFSLNAPPRLRYRYVVWSDYTHACRIHREHKPESMQEGLGNSRKSRKYIVLSMIQGRLVKMAKTVSQNP
jgi:hypothetical protein